MENGKNLVSVIVPVYNREKYLRTCLDSIMGQTWREIEVIVIDDGSTDLSYEIIDEYVKKDPRIHMIRNQHKGVSASRNAGIEAAKGEFLTFIDSDDFVEADYIANLVSEIGGADLCITGYKRWEVDINKWVVYRSNSGKVAFSDVEKFPIVQPVNLLGGVGWKLYRRRIIEEQKLRFPENIEFAEDTLFLYNYLEYSRSMTVADDSGYVYRRQGEQSLAARASRQLDLQMTFLAELEKIYETTDRLSYIVTCWQLLNMWSIVKMQSYQVRGYISRRRGFYEIADKYQLKEKSRLIKPVSKGVLILKMSLLTNTFLPMELMIKAVGRFKHWDRLHAGTAGVSGESIPESEGIIIHSKEDRVHI